METAVKDEAEEMCMLLCEETQDCKSVSLFDTGDGEVQCALHGKFYYVLMNEVSCKYICKYLIS